MGKRILVLIFGIFAAGLLFGEFSALAEEQEDMRLLMGNNYFRVTRILTNLLYDENYEETLRSVKLIASHAERLQKANPETKMDKRKMFNAYAAQMKGHADNLAVIVQYIQEGKDTKSVPNTFLRPTATTHFGNILTMCVSCHDRLRKN